VTLTVTNTATKVSTTQTYPYMGNQTIPPAAFPNNITFPGDGVATGKFIAGNFDDPFFFDAGGFSSTIAAGTVGYPRPKPVNPAKPGPTEAKNFFGPNGNTLAMVFEVPTAKLFLPAAAAPTPPLAGVWMTSAINGTQVDRMGRPAINTTLIPPVPRNDLSRGERRTLFNLGSPATDVANFRADMIAVLTSPKFAFNRTPGDAAALTDSALGATVVGPSTGLLPDILTVNLSAQYTGAGFPNGRTLRDDVIDVELNLLTKGKITTDNVSDDNGVKITDGLGGAGATIKFPYIGRPNNPPGGLNP